MKFPFISLLGSIAMLSSSVVIAADGSPCTVSAANGATVNGTDLWGEVPMATGQRSATDCDISQFAWNNFLHLVSDDTNGHPRFMSLAPWYDAMPAFRQTYLDWFVYSAANDAADE